MAEVKNEEWKNEDKLDLKTWQKVGLEGRRRTRRKAEEEMEWSESSDKSAVILLEEYKSL